MAKQFYCERCAGNGEKNGGYSDVAHATIRGDGTGVVHGCLACGKHQIVVDKPCEHEWGRAGRAIVVRNETQTHARQCNKCPAIQFGTIVWDDA